MPKIPVNECPAGPAMDAAVARVLGCNAIIERYEERWVAFCNCESREHEHPTTYLAGMLNHYSTDIAAAWELVERERMRLGWTEDWDIPYVACRQSICEYGEKHPEAISRAFLKANGVEFVEVPK